MLFARFSFLQHSTHQATMTASALSQSLSTLLKRKAIEVKNVAIVSDNAVTPTGHLVDQALESIIMMDDSLRIGTDLLGLSNHCLVPDDYDSVTLRSDEDYMNFEEADEEEDENHYSYESINFALDEEEPPSEAGSRWEDGNRDVKETLVCPPHHLSPWKPMMRKGARSRHSTKSSFRERRVSDIIEEAIETCERSQNDSSSVSPFSMQKSRDALRQHRMRRKGHTMQSSLGGMRAISSQCC